MSAACGTCRFFDVIMMFEADEETAPSHPDTICRRFPPIGEGWPAVLSDDWCGEWSPS